LSFASDTERNEWAPKPRNGKIAQLISIGENLYEASVKAKHPQKVRVNYVVFPGLNDDSTSLDFLKNLRNDAFYIAIVPANKTHRQIPAKYNVQCTDAHLQYVENAISSNPNAPLVVREIDYAALILGAGCAQISQGRTNAPVVPSFPILD